jgi:hypothetical protein
MFRMSNSFRVAFGVVELQFTCQNQKMWEEQIVEPITLDFSLGCGNMNSFAPSPIGIHRKCKRCTFLSPPGAKFAQE